MIFFVVDCLFYIYILLLFMYFIVHLRVWYLCTLIDSGIDRRLVFI